MDWKKIKLNSFKISLAITLSTSLFYSIPFFNLPALKFISAPEQLMQDFTAKRVKPFPASSHIKLVTIDLASVDTFGRWPWKRKIVADLLNTLKEYYRAKVIGMTVVFSKPDINDKEYQETITDIKTAINLETRRSRRLEKVLDRYSQKANNDTILSRALSRQSKLVTGYRFILLPDEAEKTPILTGKLGFRLIYPSRVTPLGGDPNVFYKGVPKGISVTGNLSSLNPFPKNSGFLNLIPENDHAPLRLGHTVIEANGSLYPSFALQVLKTYRDGALGKVHLSSDNEGITALEVGSVKYNTAPAGTIKIRYNPSKTAFASYSTSQILNRSIPVEQLAGKIVLVGTDLPRVSTYIKTVVKNQTPEVEIQAQIIQNLIDRSHVKSHLWADIVVLIFILLLGLYLGYFLPQVSFIKGLFVISVLVSGFYLINSWLMQTYAVELRLFYLFVSIILNWLVMTCWILKTNREQNKVYPGESNNRSDIIRAKKDLEAEVPSREKHRHPTVSIEKSDPNDPEDIYPAGALINEPTLLTSGREIQTQTIFYFSLKSFKKWAANRTQERSFGLVKAFKSDVMAIVEMCNGQLVKSGQNSIIVKRNFFNKLESLEGTEFQTLSQVMSEIFKLQLKWKGKYTDVPPIHIGVTSQDVPFKNEILDESREPRFLEHLQHTQRVSVLNSQYGTSLLIDKKTYQNLKPFVSSREIDILLKKGETCSFKVYEPICLRENRSSVNIRGYNAYLKGLKLFRKKEWTSAIWHFEKAELALKGDAPSKRMIRKCLYYIDNPPGENWKGISWI